MPTFSERSLNNLDSCHPELQRLFKEVIKWFDCTVIEGHRGEDRQNSLYPVHTKVRWPNSKHNRTPSLAVDVVPYPIDWNDISRFYYFSGFVMGIAKAMRINIRWGGDWDRDTNVIEESFRDLPHFELIE